MNITNLNEQQANDIELRLEKYDELYVKDKLDQDINIGITVNNELIAGAISCITTFKILYVSVVFVSEAYRGKGVGRKLMEALEEKALKLGVNMIRLDTFDWQGSGFYEKIGYEQVGSYENKVDGFSEYFYIKRLRKPYET